MSEAGKAEVPRQRPRLVFVDGLRGIAALGVALGHIYETSAIFPLMPPVIAAILLHSRLGVALFFVISGFVIAYTLRGTVLTPAIFGRFVLRRSLRLDPPYFASIALALLVVLVSNFMLRDRVLPYPPVSVVIAHLFYLEDILGMPKLNNVYWTLCLEIQFYLLFALLLGIAQYLGKRHRFSVPWSRLLVFAPVAVYGLLVFSGFPISLFRGACFGTWHMFFGGVLTCWLIHDEAPFLLWLAFASLVGIHGVLAGDGMAITAVVAMGALVLFCRRPSLGAWLGGRTFQYLGRISYSLYLVHPFFGQRIANLGLRLTGHGNWSAWLWFFGAIGCAIAGAHIFWRSFELPSIRWSRHIQLEPSRRVPV